MLQPGGECLPGRGRQREPLGPAALARDRDLAGPPVDVAELQPAGLSTPQAEPSQQRQDRVVPQPAGVSRSQPASSRSISAAFRPRGSEDTCHDATAGTAPASGAAVRPVAWANRRNARSDVTIAFADHVLGPCVQPTMNAVTLPASSSLTAPAPPIPARNAFDCLE